MSKDIAIIGMSAIFPGAPDLNTYWKNIINKVNAITETPKERINHRYFNKEVDRYDRFYCSKGGFIDAYARFDPLSFGILPLAVEGMEPDQLLTLQLVYKALEDAGVWDKQYTLDKTSIIIGKGNYVGPGATRAVEIVHVAEQLVEILQSLMPQLTSDELFNIKEEFQQKKGRFSADTAMGLIPNLVASLVANRLNLGGAAYTIDAACASSLIAVDHAVQDLISGRSDMAIAGGVHIAQNATFWSIFSQLGALSKKQEIRPFDQNADGLIIGEGCGFVVLKTLDAALRDHDKIYCLIKGVGVSSDGAGTSVMNPTVKGQVKAITNAWAAASLSPQHVGYIEAHGTATPIGDRTEMETLKEVFGLPNAGELKAKIGSVKSMIGHAMPAAGMAGLIKTALALYHDTLPPTLHCDSPIDAMANTRFEPINEPTSWSASGLPLRAGVNAFGFGGINAHVVLEAYTSKNKVTSERIISSEDHLLLLARKSTEELIHAIEQKSNYIGEGDHTIAVFNPTEERLRKAINIVRKNNPWRNKQDIWYSNAPLLKKNNKIAFLFPGLDGLSVGETESIADYFGIGNGFSVKPGQQGSKVFGSAFKQLQNSIIIDIALKKLGVKPYVNAGHSMGEWLAGLSAGLVTTNTIQTLLEKLDPELFEVPDVKFIVVGTSYEHITPLLSDIPSLHLANDNCPQQVILCGRERAVEQLISRLKAQQIYHQILPFQSGFHTPFIQDRVPKIIEGIEIMEFLPAAVPIWSATTLAPYPSEVQAIKQLNVAHLIQPVRFRELIEKLYHEEGISVFIQIGSGSITGFVDDTLKGHAYHALSASSPHRDGLSQLRRILAALFIEGYPIDLNFLGIEENKGVKKQLIDLKLGSEILTNWDRLPTYSRIKDRALPIHSNGIKNPLAQLVAENMGEAVGLYTDLINLLEKNKSAPAPTSHLSRGPIQIPLEISLASHSYLLDHALVKQKPGWHCPEDMDPVIPMTMILELLGEAAQANAYAKHLVSLQQIRVFQWMNVSKPFKQTINGSWIDDKTLRLVVDKYAEAQAIVRDTYSMPPTQQLEVGSTLGMIIDVSTIYDRHMFHGPAYQGIKSVDYIGQKGIRGIIRSSGGKGSLLDNAGQLFGLWLQLTLKINRVAFPIKIEDITFYQDFRDQEGLFECTCELTHINDETATADFLLKRNGKVWAIIRGWQNIRLEFDERLWQVSMAPRYNFLSEEIYPEIFQFNKAYQKVISWDFIAKRYLPLSDRNYLDRLPLNRKKKWLISRVAVRDAVRALIAREKGENYFPIEFTVSKLPSGQPVLEGAITENIHISIAHKHDEAVAIARYNKPVGIDIEEITERGIGFEEISLTSNERLLLKGKAKYDEWITRFWVAKEAYGKSIGKGLAGNPRAYQVSALEGDELIIEGTKVNTVKYKNYIIGWTL